MSINGAISTAGTVVVAVDVGENTVALSVTDAARHPLYGLVDFAMTGPGLASVVNRVCGLLPADATVMVGIEAAGHYQWPLLTPTAWPAGWQVLELNPAHVREQRRVQGRRRAETGAIDLEAITSWCCPGAGAPSQAGSR
jgi:transposase